MGRRLFATVFISTHVLFVVLYIWQQSRVVRLSFENQSKERKIAELLRDKDRLSCQLLALNDHKNIKKFAETNLGMKHLKLAQLRKLPQENPRSSTQASVMT